jgi:hypothetical protein
MGEQGGYGTAFTTKDAEDHEGKPFFCHSECGISLKFLAGKSKTFNRRGRGERPQSSPRKITDQPYHIPAEWLQVG